MTRYLGHVINSSFVQASSGGGRSGVWTVPELMTVRQGTLWHSPTPVLTATTSSTVNAGSYTFSAQAIGDFDVNKVLYVISGGAGTGTTGQTAITVGGSAATLVTTITSNNAHLALAAIQLQSTTTTADVVVTFGSTVARSGIHIFSAFPNKMEAAGTTSIATATTVSTGETMSLSVPPGAFVIAGFLVQNLITTTVPFTAGCTNAAAITFPAGEDATLVTGIASPTTALRAAHSITTTHSTTANTPLALFAAAIF